MSQNILVTHEDRRRLGTMLDAAQLHSGERLEYLRALEAAIEQAQSIEAAEVPHDVVTMNATVELRDLDTQEREIYTVVYPDRADIEQNRISVLAPIGTAILGCRIGDIVEVKVPSGWRRIRVEEIDYQPERAGRFDL
jgi:regulator of nucleoside diphosphate kinase